MQGTLQTGDRVEQQIPINFTVHTQQCTSCTRNAAKDFWNACVQVRQKVSFILFEGNLAINRHFVVNYMVISN